MKDADLNWQLLAELQALGIKHDPTAIVGITKLSDGEIIFLETGNAKAGLQHILDKHGEDFVKRGIASNQLADAIMTAIIEKINSSLNSRKRIMVRRIKLMADYHCDPLWDMEEPDNIDPAELPLKQETIERLRQWAISYNNTLNINDPEASDFATQEDAEAFELEGIKLWKQLQQELASDYEIFYFSEQYRKLLSSDALTLS